MAYTENDIINGCRSGDTRAIDAVSAFITPLIRHKLFSFDDWEDVRQVCMVEILQTLDRTNPVNNLWGLVRKVTVCTVIDFNRRQQAEKRVIARSLPGEQEIETAPPSGNPGPASDHTDIFEARDQFLYIFQRLGGICQEIIRGLFMEGLSYAELAASLGVTEGNLRIRLMRCREKARKLRNQLSGDSPAGNRRHP